MTHAGAISVHEYQARDLPFRSRINQRVCITSNDTCWQRRVYFFVSVELARTLHPPHPPEGVLLPNLIDVSSVNDVTNILVTVRMNEHVAYTAAESCWRLLIFPVRFIIHEAMSYEIMWC